MPRDLADVLHHFLPESGSGDARDGESPGGPPPRAARGGGPPRLPILGLPIGDGDVVRAAFAWNLAVEIARLGARTAVVAPAEDAARGLWPAADGSFLGPEVVLAPATNPGQLYRAALAAAETRPAPGTPDEGGLVFVRVPPRWLREARGAGGLLHWLLILTSSEPRDLLESYGLAKLAAAAAPEARIGITLHGARRAGEAEAAFAHLAGVAARRLGLSLASYGVLVDDLHVYRAAVAQRPVGTVQPQSPAARSLAAVARLLLEDAQKPEGRVDA